MTNARLLLATQWLCLLLYAKFGYFAQGDAGAHWARFFYLSNQIIFLCWLYLFYHNKINRYDIKIKRAAFWLNVFLLLIWGEHYIPIWNDVIEHSGILIPIAAYTALYLFITYLINFRKNK